MPPQVNATLTEVRGAGTAADFDVAAGAGAVKWAGSEEAYYRERRARAQTPETSSVVVERFLIVDSTAPAIAEGDVLAFYTAAGDQSGAVRAVESRMLPGVPADLQTTRLTLEET